MIDTIRLKTPFGRADDCLKICNDQANEAIYSFGEILELNGEYTFSCWFRADIVLSIVVQISDKRSQIFPISTEWTKVVFTADADINASKKVFFTIPSNQTLYAYEGMLEIGNIASDFKPSEKDIENVVTTLQTNFTVQQGKIESLIKETTIDNGDGTTTSLKDAYNQTVQTVEGNKTTIANIKTSVDDVTGKVTKMESSITEIKETADGITTTVTANKDKWDKASSDASNAVSTANNAQTIANQAASKFQWIVKSGSSATDFTLTDRTAQLVANNINLNGLVTFKGLDSSTQNKITEASNKIDNLKIGGRNLIKYGKGDSKNGIFKNFTGIKDGYAEFTLKSKKTYALVNIEEGFVLGCREYKVGAVYIWSYDIMFTEWNFPSGTNRNEFWFGQRYTNAPSGQTGTGQLTKVTSHNLPEVGSNGCKLNEWYHVEQKIIIPAQASANVGTAASIQFYNSNANIEASFTARLKNVKLELGNKATDWTPAPEDKADQSIIDNWAKDATVNGETTINGGYIKTNTIKTDQLAVDDIFATGSAAMNVINAQEINANRITSGQLSAERINAYGLSVLNKDNNQQTFNITNNGEVTIKGSVSSSNYNIGKTGWSINNDGTAEFNDIIARGSVITNDGGIVSSGGSGRNLLKRYIRAGRLATKIDDSSITVGVGSIGDTCFYLKPWVKLIKGKTYTISCDASNVPSNAPDWAFGVRVQGSSFVLIINKNGRCYGTGVLDSDVGADAEIIVDDNSNPYSTAPNITLSNFKLEEGDVATDWSPAPEDKLKQVRFWAGTSFEERESAPFIVYSDGSIKATQGEYSGLWTGDIKIGNISIVDPSSQSGNDALLTIQNGANGVKRVQLTDNTSSSFAQDVIITNNTYSPMISLKQDGSAYYSKGINIADKTTLNSTSLIINNKTLTTTSNGSGFLFSNELNVGTANQSANLIVHGNTLTDNITVDNTLYFGNVLKFTKNANGINIDFI